MPTIIIVPVIPVSGPHSWFSHLFSLLVFIKESLILLYSCYACTVHMMHRRCTVAHCTVHMMCEVAVALLDSRAGGGTAFFSVSSSTTDQQDATAFPQFTNRWSGIQGRGYGQLSCGNSSLGFEFRMFVAGWRHALRSEWPFITIIIIKSPTVVCVLQPLSNLQV